MTTTDTGQQAVMLVGRYKRLLMADGVPENKAIEFALNIACKWLDKQDLDTDED